MTEPTPHLPALLRLIRAAALVEARLSRALSAVHGLSLREALLLMQVADAPGGRMTRADLARRLETSASTVTRMTAPLEKIGLVTREADARDARLAFVGLTDAGRERVADLRATLAERAGALVGAGWEAAEVARLWDLLGRVLADARAEAL